MDNMLKRIQAQLLFIDQRLESLEHDIEFCSREIEAIKIKLARCGIEF